MLSLLKIPANVSVAFMALIFWIMVIGVIASLIPLSRTISDLEKLSGYPFGQMCDSIFTGYVDTCPKPLGQPKGKIQARLASH